MGTEAEKRERRRRCKERKKRKRVEAFIKSRSGSLDKFVQKKPHPNSNNVDGDNNSDVNRNDHHVVDDTHVDNLHCGDINLDKDVHDTNIENENVNDINSSEDFDELNPDDDNEPAVNVDLHNVDIYDPREWDRLTTDMIKVLVVDGPKRDNSFKRGPKNQSSRRFSSFSYTRTLANNEKCDREWLVYSKELDRVFCFCCKIF
ncbi:uncharacterized protein [Rutidosis leptorrhynchoides]|uniref:uncharacterized protein n=1 Tax=Rutidosis leptorrhynchoides TaxID=125765 RepID=UPI003A9A0B59